MRALLLLVPLIAACSRSATTNATSPASAAEELLAIDRSAPILSEDVVVPLPQGRFADNRQAAIDAAALPSGHRTPVRVGISADGQHGFTLGYIAETRGDSVRHFKYLAYWVRYPQGWRIAVYRRRPAPAAAAANMMPPSLPDRLVAPSGDTAGLQAELMRREQQFSDEAGRTSLRAAFETFGAEDAALMGNPTDAAFIVGPANIARLVSEGGPATGSAVTWSADRAIVASSGDLGVTIGRIRVTASGQMISFFTIWRRSGRGATWLYVAE